MRLSLSEIMNLNCESRSYRPDIELLFFSYMGEEYRFIKKEPVRLKLTAAGTKKVLLEADISLSLEIPCARCLEPVDYPVNISVKHKLDFADIEAVVTEEDETVSYVNGYELDVDLMVYEEVMIGFPMKVLCDEDCKGLCKVCGANLNKGECGCDRTELDPRMSVIRDLFKDFDN